MFEMLTNRMLIEDISSCCLLLGPALVHSCGQIAAVLWTSVKTKTCHSVSSSLTHRLSWEHRQADRQTPGHKYLREQVRKLFAQEVTLRLAFSSRLCARM